MRDLQTHKSVKYGSGEGTNTSVTSNGKKQI